MTAGADTAHGQSKVSVTFWPEGDRVAVPAEATLLDAASLAGMDLTSLCGGEGLCGKCRMVVRQGNVSAQPTGLLSREEIRCGYVLPCQTVATGDVEVEIPPESRPAGAQIVIDLDAQRFRALNPMADAVAAPSGSLTRKL